jgi:hypothetical protein
MEEPEATVAETGISAGLTPSLNFQKKPLSVLPGTSVPLFDDDVFRKVIVIKSPVKSTNAEALTGTPPGPVPDPGKSTESAAALNAAIDTTASKLLIKSFFM